MGWPEEGASGKGKQELSVGSEGGSAPRFNSAQEGRQSSTRGSCAHLTHLTSSGRPQGGESGFGIRRRRQPGSTPTRALTALGAQQLPPLVLPGCSPARRWAEAPEAWHQALPARRGRALGRCADAPSRRSPGSQPEVVSLAAQAVARRGHSSVGARRPSGPPDFHPGPSSAPAKALSVCPAEPQEPLVFLHRRRRPALHPGFMNGGTRTPAATCGLTTGYPHGGPEHPPPSPCRTQDLLLAAQS